ncbi:MAG: PLDc N-terminal domain-containing protein [Epsilonproteobacteria bacterium]|nr:PLDc N-terminal domain-containing protein [Campylobacterota bacterium]
MTAMQLLWTYLFVIVGGLLVFTAIGHILYQKRSPTSMMSWMMAIVFLPFITVPLYFIIGIRKRESKHAKAM